MNDLPPSSEDEDQDWVVIKRVDVVDKSDDESVEVIADLSIDESGTEDDLGSSLQTSVDSTTSQTQNCDIVGLFDAPLNHQLNYFEIFESVMVIIAISSVGLAVTSALMNIEGVVLKELQMYKVNNVLLNEQIKQLQKVIHDLRKVSGMGGIEEGDRIIGSLAEVRTALNDSYLSFVPHRKVTLNSKPGRNISDCPHEANISVSGHKTDNDANKAGQFLQSSVKTKRILKKVHAIEPSFTHEPINDLKEDIAVQDKESPNEVPDRISTIVNEIAKEAVQSWMQSYQRVFDDKLNQMSNEININIKENNQILNNILNQMQNNRSKKENIKKYPRDKKFESGKHREKKKERKKRSESESKENIRKNKKHDKFKNRKHNKEHDFRLNKKIKSTKHNLSKNAFCFDEKEYTYQERDSNFKNRKPNKPDFKLTPDNIEGSKQVYYFDKATWKFLKNQQKPNTTKKTKRIPIPNDNCKLNSSKCFVNNSFEQGKRSGFWFTNLGKYRSGIRQEKSKSDWQFDRARGRKEGRTGETKKSKRKQAHYMGMMRFFLNQGKYFFNKLSEKSS